MMQYYYTMQIINAIYIKIIYSIHLFFYLNKSHILFYTAIIIIEMNTEF